MSEEGMQISEEEGTEKRLSGELTKFIILVVVMIGAVLVVSWTRPFIFDRIVPIVLGEGIDVSPLQQELTAPDAEEPTIDEPAETTLEGPVEEEVSTPPEEETMVTEEESPAVEEESPAAEGESPVTEEETSVTEGEASTTEEEASVTEEETAVVEEETPGTEAEASVVEEEEAVQVEVSPTSGLTTTHVIKTGEFLAGIAEQYGVTIDAIMGANDLVSPDRINIGDELTIPLP